MTSIRTKRGHSSHSITLVGSACQARLSDSERGISKLRIAPPRLRGSEWLDNDVSKICWDGGERRMQQCDYRMHLPRMALALRSHVAITIRTDSRLQMFGQWSITSVKTFEFQFRRTGGWLQSDQESKTRMGLQDDVSSNNEYPVRGSRVLTH
jgi:hypothetical protein